MELTGPFEDDPHLTENRFPGNVTASYRSDDPLRIVGEVRHWQRHPPEQLKEMRDNLARRQAEETATIIG